MRILFLLLSFVLPPVVKSSSVAVYDGRKMLTIGGIFPMTGSWAGGKGCLPAVRMALDDVNNRTNILPGYWLHMEANDSKCMPGLGMNVLYELLYNEPKKLMLLGPGCSVVSTFVGQAARMWNLVVLSYGSSSPALSDKKRFPTLFRTHPSANLQNPTRIMLFKKFGWTRIATIQQQLEVFASTIEDLERRANAASIEIAVRTSFQQSPENAVKNLKRLDARIIVGLFYEDKARRVFCEAYKHKLYFPKHIWFIIGWYPDDWYATPDPNINCTVEQMKVALEGHFTTEGLMLNQDNATTISGKAAFQFIDELQTKIGGSNPLSVTGYVEAPLAYDAVWALALALNKTNARLLDKNQSLEDFDYSNKEIGAEMIAAMTSTNFVGVSGKVAFDSEGDRIAWSQIEQMFDGNYTKIGFYDYSSSNLTWLNKEVFPGGKVPRDRTVIVTSLRVISLPLFVAMCLLATVGIIAGTLLLAFNCKYRHHRYFIMSQPHVNNIMLIGCIICLSAIYLQGLDDRFVGAETFVVLCQLRAWVLCIGFTLAYCSAFSKVWVIYRLTTRRKKEIKAVQEWEMYAVVGCCLLVDLLVLSTWQAIDPLRRVLESFGHEKPVNNMDEDVEIKPQLEHCDSVNMKIWLGVIYGYKGVLLLFGILLAYETRNVKVKHVNDSRSVGMSIYNVVVLCIITAPVTLIIGSHQDATFAFVTVAIFLSCFLTMGLIFIPKIMEVMKKSSECPESAVLTGSVAYQEDEERHQRLLQENEELKRQIAEFEGKIQELNHCLELKATQQHRTSRFGLLATGSTSNSTTFGQQPPAVAETLQQKRSSADNYAISEALGATNLMTSSKIDAKSCPGGKALVASASIEEDGEIGERGKRERVEVSGEGLRARYVTSAVVVRGEVKPGKAVWNDAEGYDSGKGISFSDSALIGGSRGATRIVETSPEDLESYC